MSGTLFLVSVPIGNWDDITFRALRTLKESDVVVFEETRDGMRLLSHYGVGGKATMSLNEHNESDESQLIIRMLKEGRNVSLISDAGTPVFSDPGGELVRMAIDNGVRIIPIPGPSSILPALIMSGFAADEFLFYGFLSQKSALRRDELRLLRDQKRTMIFLEAPYRLLPLLNDFKDEFGPSRRIFIGYNLTMSDERVYRGEAAALLEELSDKKVKGEFVAVVEGIAKNRKKAGEGISDRLGIEPLTDE